MKYQWPEVVLSPDAGGYHEHFFLHFIEMTLNITLQMKEFSQLSFAKYRKVVLS